MNGNVRASLGRAIEAIGVDDVRHAEAILVEIVEDVDKAGELFCGRLDPDAAACPSCVSQPDAAEVIRVALCDSRMARTAARSGEHRLARAWLDDVVDGLAAYAEGVRS